MSTPQDVAWNVAQKAILMFDKLNAPILGVIENMSHFVCNHCAHTEEIFGSGGARRASEHLEIPYLGGIPIDTAIRLTSDQGDPVVHKNPESSSAKEFMKIAEALMAQVGHLEGKVEDKKIPIKIEFADKPEIIIEWNDGKKLSYSPKVLRAACPCASCVNELTGQRIIDPKNIPDDIRALAVNIVGRYALQIVWSDRHATGLYGFDLLRKLSVTPKW